MVSANESTENERDFKSVKIHASVKTKFGHLMWHDARVSLKIPTKYLACIDRYDFFFFFFFFCVPQLYLWGSPLLGEIFAYVTVF